MKPFCPNDRNRCAPQVRMTLSISARSGARAGAGAGPGLGCSRSIVSKSAATGCRIAQRGAVELAQMRVAARGLEQHGVADVVQRRAVLAGRQRTVGGPGDVL